MVTKIALAMDSASSLLNLDGHDGLVTVVKRSVTRNKRPDLNPKPDILNSDLLYGAVANQIPRNRASISQGRAAVTQISDVQPGEDQKWALFVPSVFCDAFFFRCVELTFARCSGRRMQEHRAVGDAGSMGSSI